MESKKIDEIRRLATPAIAVELVIENKEIIAQRDELLAALRDIAGMTDADDPESYRSDDREGCLDTVSATAKAAIAKCEVQS